MPMNTFRKMIMMKLKFWPALLGATLFMGATFAQDLPLPESHADRLKLLMDTERALKQEFIKADEEIDEYMSLFSEIIMDPGNVRELYTYFKFSEPGRGKNMILERLLERLGWSSRMSTLKVNKGDKFLFLADKIKSG